MSGLSINGIAHMLLGIWGVKFLSMNGQPDTGVTGKKDSVSGVAWEQKRVSAAKLLFCTIVKSQTRFSFQYQYPFVPVLIVPFFMGGLLSAGNDPFYSES